MSKYDSYWLRLLGKVKNLLDEAKQHGRSKQIDVNGLVDFGDRKYWYGTVVVSKSGAKSEMAHATSLGNVILKSTIMKSFENATFRLRISNDLKLDAELYEAVTTAPHPRVISEDAWEIPTVEGQMNEGEKTIERWLRKDFRAEEIVGEDRTINKLQLVKDFLNSDHCKERRLISSEDLSVFLRREIAKRSGVYCIYNVEKKEVFDVGKSKNLRGRIKQQLIGVKGRKDRRLKFPRLFFAVLKKEKGIKEKDYKEFSGGEKDSLIEFFQNVIFRSNNVLRVCFTKDHLRAIVLEHTLIKYFKSEGQCKYNFQQ